MNKLIEAIKNRSLKPEDLRLTIRGFEGECETSEPVLTSQVRTDLTSPQRKEMVEGQMSRNRLIPNRLTGESELTRYDPYGRVITGGIGQLLVSTPSAMSDIHVSTLLKQMGAREPLFVDLTDAQVLHLLKEEAHKMVAEKKAKNKRRRQRRKANMKARRK